MSLLLPDKQPEGRGGSETAGAARVPRYLYYRIYTKDGPINSNNPLYANDPFISRTLTNLITPPHTALTVKVRLCSIEGFSSTTECTLFESFSSQIAIENSTRIPTRGKAGPGHYEHEPVILVVGLEDVEKRSATKVRPGRLPDAALREPRYLYYRLYKGMEGAMASKTCFDQDNDTLGRIGTLSIAPPHNVASLKSRIIKLEGSINEIIQIFKDVHGEEVMNDDDQLSLLAETYPGCEEDDPIAIVCEVNHDENMEFQDIPRDQRFTKLIRVTVGWAHSPPVWLSVTPGEELKTDGVRTTAMHNNDRCSFPFLLLQHIHPNTMSRPANKRYEGYMAMNAGGTIGFVLESNIIFC